MRNVDDPKNYPAQYKKRRYYTPNEVKLHNIANDIWVSFFHEVYDITELIQQNYSHLVDPIIKEAGEDITHWFDYSTRDVKLKNNLSLFNLILI
jgi:cytochrome b involved in lipid metabolism